MKFPKALCKKKNTVNVIIETPKGSRLKYDYDEKKKIFAMKKILPSGTSFPLDFGFIPHTLAADGDPVDVLVFVDMPCNTGSWLECRLVGVIEATQTEKGQKPIRNDRLIAVAVESFDHSKLMDIEDVDKHLLKELIHFFEYYNDMCGKKFKFLKTQNAKTALALVKKSIVV